VTDRLLRCACLLALLVAPRAARGSDLEQRVARGVQRFDEGQFEAALSELAALRGAAAGDARQLARIELYSGLSHAVLGKTEDARRAFRAALVQQPELRLDPDQFKPELVALFNQVIEGLVGELQVEADSPGAAVELDGKGAGRVPHLARLPIGAHYLIVRAPGGGVFERRLTIYPDRRVTVTAQLGSTAPRRRIWTWVTAGTAVVALGLGIGLWAWAGSQHDEYSKTADPVRFDELKSSVHQKDIAANVLWISAGALAATSVVLFFLEGRAASRPPAERSAGLRLLPSGLAVRF
jgi:hypothetical protein